MKESSDNTNRPKKLEEVFRDGFEPAEVKPGAHLWNRIEQELESKQANYYKKRLAWYRRVAAASIALLLLATAYFWYDTQTAPRFNAPSPMAGTAIGDQVKPTPPMANIPAPKATQPVIQPKARVAPAAVVTENNIAARPPAQKPVLLKLPRFSGQNQPETTSSAAPPVADQNALPPNNLAVVKESRARLAPGNDSLKPAAVPTLALEPAGRSTDGLVPPDSVRWTNQAPLNQSDQESYPLLAAPEPAKTNSAAPTSRWALGGGGGSQYFQQNIKLGSTSGNALTAQPASNIGSALSINSGGVSLNDARKEFNENTRSAFSYRAAVAGNYKFNSAWSLEAGLTFAENKAQTVTSFIINKLAARNSAAYYNADFLKNTTADQSAANNVTIPVTIFLAELTDGYLDYNKVTVDKVAPFNVYYRYRQVGVPVKLRYQQGRGNWFTFVQAGGALNILLQTSIFSDSPRVPNVAYTLGQNSPFRKWYFIALGSVGRGLRVSEVWQVQGSLDVARNFSTLTMNPEQIPQTNQRKSYYVGFGISSSYIIGKKSNLPQ